MFVIELVYKVDLATIDSEMRAHVTWLRTHYAAGTFLASGRKIPRDGGVILAIGHDRAQIEAIVREDPAAAGRVCRPHRWSSILQGWISRNALPEPGRISNAQAWACGILEAWRIPRRSRS